MIKKYNKFINEHYGNDDYNSNIEILLGRTLTNVEVLGGDYNDRIVFTVDDGSEYSMFHEQDCCESVTIDDINGDLDDLVGSPILQAKMVTNNDEENRKIGDGDNDSFTWTFYKLATAKGYVVIRWYGTSNGYYSESVGFYKTK